MGVNLLVYMWHTCILSCLTTGVNCKKQGEREAFCGEEEAVVLMLTFRHAGVYGAALERHAWAAAQKTREEKGSTYA